MNKRNDELDLIIKILSEMFPEFKVKYAMRSGQSTNAQGGEWLPIERAPKDGSRILAFEWWNSEIRFGIVSYASGECELVDEKGKGLGWGFYPTHWQRLPLPPITPPSEG